MIDLYKCASLDLLPARPSGDNTSGFGIDLMLDILDPWHPCELQPTEGSYSLGLQHHVSYENQTSSRKSQDLRSVESFQHRRSSLLSGEYHEDATRSPVRGSVS